MIIFSCCALPIVLCLVIIIIYYKLGYAQNLESSSTQCFITLCIEKRVKSYISSNETHVTKCNAFKKTVVNLTINEILQFYCTCFKCVNVQPIRGIMGFQRVELNNISLLHVMSIGNYGLINFSSNLCPLVFTTIKISFVPSRASTTKWFLFRFPFSARQSLSKERTK